MAKYQNIINKIREIYEEPTTFIPLHAPTFIGNEKKYLLECIDSSFVSSVGKFVDAFEEKIVEYTGAHKAVVCVNGTNALHLALSLVGVKSGDEVLTQSLTFVATANAISYCNASPIFIDVDKNTMGLSPKCVEEWLAENTIVKNKQCINKNTHKVVRACVPMHTFGHSIPIDELIEICNKYYIEVVEDAAESIGSFYKGKHTGTFGKVGVLSFNGNKTITCGGGGILLFNDEKLASAAKHLTTQAKIPHKWEFNHDEVGYNYRMPNINAAVGVAQLEQLPLYLKSKRDIAFKYQSFFEKTDITFLIEPEHCQSSYWLNAIIFSNKEERDLFLTESNEAGVMTRPIWNLMSELPMYKNCQRDNLTVSCQLANTVVNIPSSVKV